MHNHWTMLTLVVIIIVVGVPATVAVLDPDTFVQPRDVLNNQCQFRDNGTAGVCRRLVDCPAAIAEMRSTRRLMPTSCGFEGKTPIVCCLMTRPVVRSVQRASVIACSNYKQYLPNIGGGFNLVAQRRRRRRRSSLLLEPGDIKINVVGGTLTKPAEFPHMSALGYTESDGSRTWKCGGTLISAQYVLTAAHCVRRQAPVVVRIGEHDLNQPLAAAHSEHHVGQVIVHPGYTASRSYNDIALLRLNGSVGLSERTRPACLWQPSADLGASVKLLATGFGLTEYAGHPSAKLLKVELALVPTPQCAPQYNKVRTLPQGFAESQLCAGDATGKRDTCQGDSGGPLQTTVERQPHVVGITSFGQGCATRTPGVYTRVSSFVPWIEGIVWPDGA